jgi:hypothetical protein
MTILRLEIQVRDYDLWPGAFESDAGGRQQAGIRRYRIFRPLDPHRVMVDADFDRAEEAQAFLQIMRTKVWPDPEKAPAKVGDPRTHIVELVESREYSPTPCRLEGRVYSSA